MQTDENKKKNGSLSRNSGKHGELALMHILRDVYGYPVRRGKVFYGESDLVNLRGIHVECKNQAKPNVYAAYRQAVEESKKRNDGAPVVFVHKKGDGSSESVGGWNVYMSLELFMDFYGAWEANDERD